MVPFPPEKAHSSPPRILSRIAHISLEFCRDCIDCGRFSPLGGNVAFSAFQSSSSLCNPPFPPCIRSPLRNPTPIFSVPMNSSGLPCPNRTTKSLFTILCFPTFSSSLQSSTSPPTTLPFLHSQAILTRNSVSFHNRRHTRNPTHAILHGNPACRNPMTGNPACGNPTRRQSHP